MSSSKGGVCLKIIMKKKKESANFTFLLAHSHFYFVCAQPGTKS